MEGQDLPIPAEDGGKTKTTKNLTPRRVGFSRVPDWALFLAGFLIIALSPFGIGITFENTIISSVTVAIFYEFILFFIGLIPLYLLALRKRMGMVATLVTIGIANFTLFWILAFVLSLAAETP